MKFFFAGVAVLAAQAALALGPRFLGAWKGDNLAVLPDECYWIKKIPDTRGLVIFFR